LTQWTCGGSALATAFTIHAVEIQPAGRRSTRVPLSLGEGILWPEGELLGLDCAEDTPICTKSMVSQAVLGGELLDGNGAALPEGIG